MFSPGSSTGCLSDCAYLVVSRLSMRVTPHFTCTMQRRPRSSGPSHGHGLVQGPMGARGAVGNPRNHRAGIYRMRQLWHMPSGISQSRSKRKQAEKQLHEGDTSVASASLSWQLTRQWSPQCCSWRAPDAAKITCAGISCENDGKFCGKSAKCPAKRWWWARYLEVGCGE